MSEYGVIRTEVIEPIEVLTEVSFSPIPPGDVNRVAWEVTVEYRSTQEDGTHLYAVKHFSHCLSRGGSWDWESRPSEREDEWLAEHRFPYDEAVRLAKQHCMSIKVNGMTAVAAAALVAARSV